MRLRRIVLSLLVSAIFAASVPGQNAPSAAKPDNTQEALVYESVHDSVRFENDGTGVEESTNVVRVQSQAGIEALGQLVFGYSSASEELKIDYVRVRKPDGHVVETPASTAQDFAPDVLKEAPMYSDYRERHVSVAGLQVGDLLEYHTITQMKSLAPGEFWYEHSFLKSIPAHEQTLEIDLPKSREVKFKNPKHKYEMREAGDRRIYTWTIKDFAPERKDNEEESQDEEDDTGPDVQLSTFTDWQQIARWYAGLQSDRAAVDGDIRKTAEEVTKGATTPGEKARRLYDYVARNIRYVSLSFGVGRFQPHQASEVLQNRYGDCKDKHTLLQAMLRAIGITSYPVLISSDHKLDLDMPSPAQFDHVITAAQIEKDGSFTWLDTTAEVAPYGMIMYELRNKQALLAAGDANAGLRRTPATSPVQNRLLMNINGKFTELGAFDATIEMTAEGDSDFPMRAVMRGIPQSEWKRSLQVMSAAWGFAGEVTDIQLSPVEDTSKPFHLTYHLHQDSYFRVPSSDAAFEILPSVRSRRAASKKSSEPIDIGPSVERIYKAHVQFPANYTVHVPTEVRMARDYGEYSSSYLLSKNTLDAERRMVLKVNELPATRRSDYESFRTVTTGSGELGLWCSIAPASAAAEASAAQLTGTPEELRKAGMTALHRRDFSVAADLLKRSLDQDAKQKDAWQALGLAYAGLNQHELAVSAFRKQIELDPLHVAANRSLAAELEQQGKLDDAVAAYKKQIEITPSEKFAHKSLGLLLARMKHDDEARTELETAAAIPPEDPQVKIALAQVYARAGNAEKGQALMKSVLGVANLPAGGDIFAAALRDDIDLDEAQHDARQTLDNIGDQFDAGEYELLPASAFSAMNLVALSWGRLGWSGFLRGGDTLGSMQFLNSSWMLSQSGTVANRLARVYLKENQKEKARHMFALATAAGGDETQSSREQLLKLSASPDAADKEIEQCKAELLQMRTVKLPALAAKGSAQFGLMFDGTNKPERAEYLEGDAALRSAADKLRDQEYPVRFPDVTSVKIIRRASVTCGGDGCAIVLLPLDNLQP